MKLLKYMTLRSKLSEIEGRKESLDGQHSFSTKMMLRGEMDDVDFQQHENVYHNELRNLAIEKRSALRHYIAAWRTPSDPKGSDHE